MKKIFLLPLALIAMAACQQNADKESDSVAVNNGPEHYENNVFYYQRATLFDSLPVYPTDIIMLGNSLTNGCEWHELFNNPNVKNRGISSDVIQGVRERLQPIIDGQPAKVFILTGTNDVSHNLGVDSIATAYGALIDYMRQQMPNTKLYVQSLLPINITHDMYLKMADKEQQIRDINARLAEMADEKGFTWIDLYASFVDEDGHMKDNLTNDGLHLLGPGYMLWRDQLLPYINE